jgi:hypothetical protein
MASSFYVLGPCIMVIEKLALLAAVESRNYWQMK